MRITRHFKNFLKAMFIAVYAFAVSPAEYLHHHLLHNLDAGISVQDSTHENGKVFKNSFSKCDTKCPVCHHKLLGEEHHGNDYTTVFALKKITGKITFSPGFPFSFSLFSLSDRGPPVML